MTKTSAPPPDSRELTRLALDLLSHETTMTLSTSGPDGAWAAPVYYLFHKGGFHFFSSPDSRHIREALTTGQAAAAVHARADSWQDIRGLQMTGAIRQMRPGLKAARAIGLYLKRYPFTSEFFKNGEEITLEAFISRFRVRLYRFEPETVLYQDNHIRFSFREEVSLLEN